ncbi:MAG: C_GCAxxG_C_C family protein [Lachnospiraceae bacterium]|nr:C_GCAxxG_C_C family protein [Lachnospiraceae bacterium]
MERAEKLRACTERHYNCAQSVLVPFADVLGTDGEILYRVGANFGSGMRVGSVCGAVTGALMVLGLAGVNDSAALQTLYGEVREKHDGLMNCSDLLRVNKEKGGDRKVHCDDMVYELLAVTEEILRERGIIA